MVTTVVEKPTDGAIKVQDGRLVVHEYINRDPDVVAYFASLDGNAEPELGTILSLGVRVRRTVAPSVDLACVERRFEELEAKYREILQEGRDAIVEGLQQGLQPIVDEDGPLAANMKELANTVGQLLAKYFGEESAAFVGTLVARKVEQLLRTSQQAWQETMAETHVKQQRAVAAAFDLNDPSSPLSLLMKKIDSRDQESVKLVTDLITRVSAVVERREARGVTMLKGSDYQDAVLQSVGQIAQCHGDVFEDVSVIPGIKGKKGDGLVTVDEALTAGTRVRIVFEVKNQSDIRLADILRELDAAIACRDAAAAIAVLPSTDVPASSGSRLQRCGDGRFVCVVDPDTEDLLPLEVAYALGRAEAVRSASSSAVQADLASVVTLADRAVAQLQQLTKVERQLGAGRKNIDEALALVIELRTQLRSTLAEIRAVASGD
jgi:hypothetical protein